MRRCEREALHLEQPWLECSIDHDVVAVALEAVTVVDHHVLARLERMDDSPADVRHQLGGSLR
mgnify:CR=1 FL=1